MTSNAEEADGEWLVLRQHTRPFRTNTPKRCPFHYSGLESKVGSQEIPGVTGKFGLRIQNEVGQRLTEFCQENAMVIEKHPLPTTQEMTLHMDITRWSILKSD